MDSLTTPLLTSAAGQPWQPEGADLPDGLLKVEQAWTRRRALSAALVLALLAGLAGLLVVYDEGFEVPGQGVAREVVSGMPWVLGDCVRGVLRTLTRSFQRQQHVQL